MNESTLVLNESLSMCCGQPGGQCTCKPAVRIRNWDNPVRPEPLGLPDWSNAFGAQQPKTSQIVPVHNADGPSGGHLGLPVMQF